MSKHWVKWNCDATSQEIVEDVIEVVNDIIRKNKMRIDVNYDHDEDWNYHIKLYEEKIKWKEKYGHQKKQKELESY